jgi:hypothetical protein
MITVSVRIDGLDSLKAAFKRAPSQTLRYLASATRASILELDKQAIDSNMQFRTPRSQRTGFLVQTWGLNKEFRRGGLQGTTGPIMDYAPYVYFGARGRRPNKYLDRIAAAAEPKIQKHFDTAVDKIVINLTK